MPTQPHKTLTGLLIAAVIVVAVAVGAVAVLRQNWSGEGGSGLPAAFDYNLQKYQKIDPALFCYHQAAEIPLDLRKPRAIACGTDDHILVAGDKVIHLFGSLPQGKTAGGATTAPAKLREINLDAEPYSLTVGNAEHAFPGRIYVGMWDHVEVFEPDGIRAAVWPTLGILTSVTTSEHEVFVADAKAKVIWRFNPDGKPRGQIGGRGADGVPPFVVPSPWFAVAMSPDGLLRAANPGAHQVEAFTLAGHLELSWGKAGEEVEAFCGCCNPSYLAILPDGRIVTSEKGLPRVKVYSPTGEFIGAVVGPEVLAPTNMSVVETRDEHRLRPAAIAADSQGRILVLDAAAQCVRIFVENAHEQR